VVILPFLPSLSGVPRNPEGVNRVGQDGRFMLPGELGERLAGKHLAAFVEDDGTIRLQPVEADA
jgi:hypothetical protein